MKKILLALAAASITIAASAQTNQVLSRNAVGYQRFDLAKGSLSLLRTDFYLLDGGIMKATNLFQRQLPRDTIVYYYDNSLPGYISDVMGNTRFNTTNITFRPGMSFWVSIPTTAVSNNYTLYIMGEVPDQLNQAGTNFASVVPPGLSQAGYPYPVPQDWTNTAIAKLGRKDDQMFYWDGVGYQTLIRGNTKWNTNIVLQPGQGFFLSRTNLLSSTNWVEPKPYTWPK